jgi:hypothetical protein
LAQQGLVADSTLFNRTGSPYGFPASGMKSENLPFDYRRHFRELFRIFLPIFIAIGAVLIVIFVVIMPGEREDPWQSGDPSERVGLLSADPDVPLDPAFAVLSAAERAGAPRAVRFDAPMGSPLGALTYNAQPFLITRHLGDDLNGIGGNDSDLGDAVYAVADGEVIYAGWPSDGWGNVVILLHLLPDGRTVESFYGHLKTIRVAVGTEVRRGERVGTVGKGDGRYLAHLHFEMRSHGTLASGQGYADTALGRISGEKFLSDWRGAPPERQNHAPAAAKAKVEMPAIRFSTGGESEAQN